LNIVLLTKPLEYIWQWKPDFEGIWISCSLSKSLQFELDRRYGTRFGKPTGKVSLLQPESGWTTPDPLRPLNELPAHVPGQLDKCVYIVW